MHLEAGFPSGCLSQLITMYLSVPTITYMYLVLHCRPQVGTERKDEDVATVFTLRLKPKQTAEGGTPAPWAVSRTK